MKGGIMGVSGIGHEMYCVNGLVHREPEKIKAGYGNIDEEVICA